MNVSLRRYKKSDIDDLCRLFLNDRVLENLATTFKAKDVKRGQEKEFIKRTIDSYKFKKPAEYDLVIMANGKFIGGVGANHIDYEHQKAEIGYWLGEPHWGKGYATEAVKLFVKFLFKKFNFKRIEAAPYDYNKESQRVLEKAGFRFEKERKEFVKRFGKFYTDRVYAIMR